MSLFFKILSKTKEHKTYIIFYLVGPPYTLRLKVKFYSSEPNTLREELTRYQFFLQLKQDVLEGKLHCPHQVAVQLAALALQCKFIQEVFLIILLLLKLSYNKIVAVIM